MAGIRASSSRALPSACTSTATSSAPWRLAPANADYVAMSDQDDFWHPDKLETLLDAIGGSQLVFSDARIIDREGGDLRHLLEHPAPESPEPALAPHGELGDRSGVPVQARCAGVLRAAVSAAPVLAFSRPLDRARRAGPRRGRLSSVRSTTTCNTATPSSDTPAPTGCLRCVTGSAGSRRTQGAGVRRRLHYFVDCCRLIQFTTILEMRCGSAMSAGRRRALRRFPTPSARSHGPISAAGRCASCSASRRRSAPRSRCSSPTWRRLVLAATRGLERPRRHLRIDARTPMTLPRCRAGAIRATWPGRWGQDRSARAGGPRRRPGAREHPDPRSTSSTSSGATSTS